MLERGFILPNCGVTEPNDEIPMKEWNMKVITLNLPSCIEDANLFSLGPQKGYPVAERKRICQR
jgi:hypothetical protein